MRLIDADALKRSISQNNKIPRIFQQVINSQPTAYDVSKVVEELEGETSCPNCSMYCADANICGFEEMQKQAIEIVKQGGASDDECEWKYVEKYKISPLTSALALETSCKKIHFRQDEISQFNYCPYCGKKIKVVNENDDD